MANEVDQLSLKIDIKATNEDATTIKNIASAIRSLNNAVKNTANISNYVKELSRMSSALKSVGKTSPARSATKLKKETVSRDSTEGELPTIKSAQESAQVFIKNAKQMDNWSKKMNKRASSFNKLMNSIGRIAFYRIIRTAMKELVQGLQEGLTNLRATDKELDTSLKKLQLSGTSLKNSFAAMISPLIKTIEPVVTRIADGIANIVNRIEEAKAAMNGATTYTKILTSDSKEWNEQLKETEKHLLSFDKFESLTKKQQGYTGTVEASVGMSQEEGTSIYNRFKLIETAIYGVVGAMAALLALKFASKLTEISSSLLTMKKGSEEATAALKKQHLTTKALALTGIATLATGIVTLVANWNQMSKTAKILVPVLSVLAGVIATIIALVAMGTGNWVKALSIGAIATGIGLSVGSTLSAMQFANGGTFSSGTMFIAGEAGAEAVYNTSGGNGGVVNIEQFTSAMYNALVAYGAAKDRPNGGNVYLDSTRVGQLVEKSVYNEGVRVGHFGK